VYEELRALLREELGATPSPPIQALQLRLLKAAGPA
jgi:Bacterial transcriptional activator domain